MIALAKFPGTPDADFNVVGYHEAMKRLIWIAQNEARMEVWKMISETTKQNHDMEACKSYPCGFFQKRHPSARYDDDRTYSSGGFGLVKNDQK